MRFAEIRNTQRELYYFQLRLGIAGAIVLGAFAVLFGRFFYLQVIQSEYYATRAEDNRIFIMPIPPNRGLIVDRNGVVLARNYSAYTLELTLSKIPDLEGTIEALSALVDIQPKDRRRFRKLREESKGLDTLPLRTRLTDEEVARLAVNRHRFPGMDIKGKLFRQYPLGELGSHVVGYIGRIDDRDLERLDEADARGNYKGSDHIGKTGLERSYETALHGTTGFDEVETDAGGRIVTDAGGRIVKLLRRAAPAESGNDLRLTLDIGLQETVERAFGERRGAMVAIEPSTGAILAFVSKPGYDPNLFVDGIDPANWDALNNSPDHPLNNRALTGLYAPGSTFKPFMALAALELGARTPNQLTFDPGYFTLGNNRFRDFKADGHGYVDMVKSIVVSCDTYYYVLANDLGIDNIASFMSQFGFGARTGIDLEGEVGGSAAFTGMEEEVLQDSGAAEVVRGRDHQHRHRPGLSRLHAASARDGRCRDRQRRSDDASAPGGLCRESEDGRAHAREPSDAQDHPAQGREPRSHQARHGRGQQGGHGRGLLQRGELHQRAARPVPPRWWRSRRARNTSNRRSMNICATTRSSSRSRR